MVCPMSNDESSPGFEESTHPPMGVDFELFWQHFLTSHTDPVVRAAHVVGLLCGVVGVGRAIQKRSVVPLLLGGGAFAALAIASHPVRTGKWPENFGQPALAARAFLRLCLRTVTGSIRAELLAPGVEPQ